MKSILIDHFPLSFPSPAKDFFSLNFNILQKSSLWKSMDAASTLSKVMLFSRFLTLVAIIICHANLVFGAGILPPEEVDALKQIAKTIGKTWNFSVNPCSGEGKWITDAENDAVNCSCSSGDDSVCHVIRMLLKEQNLQGTVPPELVRLPFLQEIDLTRNYLNGTIPKEWGSMQLVKISLNGNRVSETIPKELGNISTLTSLTLEFNLLSGAIPSELGDLPHIERLFLTSNNLTGELPRKLANLATLKDFRIGDNQFVGSIPNFVRSWINIEKLVIQGSGLSGPIPPGIASLTNLTDLRISDLNGNDSAFPPLGNAKNLETLILRSCNIIGQIPDHLDLFTKLKILDLSFNKISGPIPNSLSGLLNIRASRDRYIYLTGNFLNGTVPDWMLGRKDNIDLSFNNLRASTCQPNDALNLFTSSRDNSGIDSCLRSHSCPQEGHTLRINCGGGQVDMHNGASYDGDVDSGGASKFFSGGTNWAFSSTGHFLDSKNEEDYIMRNNSVISGDNSKLYMEARLSPLSLTYYGFCMRNGKYKVNLHFAEIMFTENRTYSSLGRRLFDIYIQGKLVQKDFNIEDKAGGVNKPIVEPFTAEIVDNTLEIRFYWAGKGTIGLPTKGVYGPLISAISVDHDFPLSDGLSAGAIVGIILAVIFSVSLLLVVLWQKGCFPCKYTTEQDLMGLNLQTGSFTLRQMKVATNNFDAANKIGEGGFGSVYKGVLSDGTIIAVKQLSSKSKQGNREFVNEIGMISALQHPNLVKLYGCCIEGNQLLLVYEYMENNSLARALFGPKEHQLELDWTVRHKISIGIARGLAYLHEESRLKIVHRDIKATNVLLDKDLNPKISDFGLAKLDEEENTHISTRIAGTYGYMAPEYAMRGYLTDKADVYSFGIVLLEIVSGKSNTSIKPKEDCFNLLDWAHLLKKQGKLIELVDPRLGSNFNKEQVMLSINLALVCTNVSPTGRPSMSTVVTLLGGKDADESLISSFEIMTPDKNAYYYQASHRNDSQMQSTSSDAPYNAAFSTSASDLYPVNLDSYFLENRL